MKRTKRGLLVASIVVSLLSLVVSGCGGNNESKPSTTASASQSLASNEQQKQDVTLSVQIPQAKYKELIYKKLAENIKSKEHITLEYQVVPDDQFENLLRTKIATKEVPDLVVMNLDSKLASIGATNFLDLTNEPWVTELINPNLIKNKVDGNIYGLPIVSSQGYIAVWYNKKVFEDLGLTEPDTYAEFTSILDKIKNSGKDIVPFYEANRDPWASQIFMTNGFAAMLEPAARQDTFDKLVTNKMKFSDVPAFHEVLSLYKELYDKGYVNKDNLSATYDMSQTALGTGKAAMVLNGEFIVNSILEKYPDVQIGSFLLPFHDRKVLTTGVYVDGWLIPKDTKNIEAAKRVLSLLSTPEYGNLIFEGNPGPPAFKGIDGGELNPAIQSLIDEYIVTGNYIPEFNESIGIGQGAIDQAWKLYIDMAAGSKSEDQVLKDWDKIYGDFMKSKDQPGF